MEKAAAAVARVVEGEYRSEANRLERTVLLDPLSTLSASGVSSVETLLNLAEVLNLGDVRDSSFFSAITAFQNEELELTDENKALRDQIADVEARSKDTQSKLEKVESLCSSAIEEVKRQEAEPVIPVEVLREKQVQYAEANQSYKQGLNLDFLNTQGITHSQILELAQELQAVLKTTTEEEENLKTFQDLPPNLALARQKVQEQQEIMDQLNAEFDREVTELAVSMT
jgi:hypothetical protein